MDLREIDLMTDEQLIEALFTRFEHAIFAGLKINYNKDGNYLLQEWQGDDTYCKGLASGLTYHIERETEPDEEEEDDDE